MKLSMRFAFLALFVLLASSCAKESTESPEILQAENDRAVEGALLQRVNDFRSSLGKAPLAFSQVAYDFANAHTDYMIASGSLSHHDFDSRASKMAEQTEAKSVAENVAKGHADAEAAFQNWMGSTAHRSTMEGDFSHTAVSVKIAPDGTLYFTQIFFLK